MFQKRMLFQLGMRIAFFAACFFISSDVMAAVTIGAIKTQIAASTKSLVTILQDVSMVAGIGFVIGSFFKFHQHKMNPTQVPISQGITLLLVGAGLAVFPTLVGTASQSVFGTTAGANVKLTSLIQ
jgi:intracellular multiplication protein IcmD